MIPAGSYFDFPQPPPHKEKLSVPAALVAKFTRLTAGAATSIGGRSSQQPPAASTLSWHAGGGETPMEFPGKQQRTKQKAGQGASFLAEAKHKHQGLFVQFLDQAEDFEDLEQFLEKLESAAWKFTESVAKASWKNGLIKGEQKRS